MKLVNLKKCLFMGFFCFLTYFKASAWLGPQFMIEPQLAYRFETLKISDLSKQESFYKSTHPSLGLRLGFRSLSGIDLNLAAQFSKGKFEVTNSIEKNEFTHKNLSVELGVNALSSLKIYLGYSFTNEIKIDSTSTSEGFQLSGPAYLAGLQFKLVSWIHLGIQANLNQYNQILRINSSKAEPIETNFSKLDSQDYSSYLNFSF